jgi:hypothetical protein
MLPAVAAFDRVTVAGAQETSIGPGRNDLAII